MPQSETSSDQTSATTPVAIEPALSSFDDGLERGTPSEAGIDSEEVLGFLHDIDAAGLDVHSLMLHRHGKVVAEGWRWPYRADRPRIMHSTTKSFAACAIGMAIDEGRMALADKVVSFFPDELPAVVDDKLAAMTVEDLLTMRTGQASETSGSIWRGVSTSWIAEFFKIPLTYMPGTNYVYTSAASYMLSAILTRVTGQLMHDYLKPRLFEPLGTVGETWDVGPDGINPGGNGLTARTADLLKLGILHAQDGVWNGRRLLSHEWVAAATRAQGGQGDSRYGYHWAIRPLNGFSAIGIFVQIVTVFPASGATLAITGAIDGSIKLLPHVERHFPRALLDVPRTNAAADARLAARLASWSDVRPVPLSVPTVEANRIGGRAFAMASNGSGITQLQLDFANGECTFRLTDEEGQHRVVAGMGHWIESRTSLPGRELHHGYRLRNAVVVASAHWSDEHTLEMTLVFAETAFRDTLIFHFDGDTLRFDRGVNINMALRQMPRLEGSLSTV